jgi:hypothetical protein
MTNEIKNNYLELRQEDIKDFTEEEAKGACEMLLKIMSDGSNYEITYDKEHYMPSIENSYTGEFEETNKFNEEITGHGLFFPNSVFKFKKNETAVISFYLVNTMNGVYMIIDRLHTYEFNNNAKHLNYTLKAEKLNQDLYYSVDENKVIKHYLKSILENQEYYSVLTSIKHLYKKDGSEFKDWNKSFTVKYLKNEYYVNFKIDYTYINNEPYAVDVIIGDRTIYLTSNELNNNFSRENITRQFLYEVENKKNECLHEIEHAKEIIKNVRSLINDYNKTLEKIKQLQDTLNCDLKNVLR